jgi:cytochrome c-type protein NapB
MIVNQKKERKMKKIILTIVTVGLTGTLMAGAVNGKACTGCHGMDWNKKALGKSLDVSGMTHKEIAVSLKGYKDGSYGGAMKGLMKGQIAKYSNEELEKFSETIGLANK